jgi:hypothetical protein
VSSRLDLIKKPLLIPLESEQMVKGATSVTHSKSVDEILASLRISTDIMQPFFPNVSQPAEIRRYNPNRIVEFEPEPEHRVSKRLSNNPIQNRKNRSKAEKKLSGRFEVQPTKKVDYTDYIKRTFNKVEADYATDNEEAVDVTCNMDTLN